MKYSILENCLSNLAPCAFIFFNGNAAYFDENQQQLIKMQKRGLKGMHAFHKKYPDARIFICGSQNHIPKEMIPCFLKHIRKK